MYKNKLVILTFLYLSKMYYSYQASRTGDDGFKMGGLSPSGAGASHHSAMTPQLAKGKEKLSDALKSCNEILKELFSKKHSVSKTYF